MSRWTLHYHPEITSYLIGLRESGSELRTLIRGLGDDPRLDDARTVQDWPNTYELFGEGHWIRYMILKDEKTIRTLLVNSGSEESELEAEE